METPPSDRPKLSAFVLTYNRERIIGTCLRAVAFADEVIVVDKSSTDNTRAIATPLADRVITVPWSPSGDETRTFALSQCTHDWVLFLDDDECLNVEAVRFLDAELRAPRADFYALPLRHYILGMHDERAYYWPEHHVRFFRRGSIEFLPTAHDTMRMLSDRGYTIPAESGPCIHHLSHRDAAQWIDKTNRYTSLPNRRRSLQAGTSLARFAHEQIDHWLERTKPCEPDSYPVAVAVLRAVYDMIDRVKGWEEEAGLDGDSLFAAACARLDAAYAAELTDLARPRAATATAVSVDISAPDQATARTDTATLARAVQALRESVRAQRDAVDAMRTDAETARNREAEQRAHAAEMQRWAESAVRDMRAFETTLGQFRDHHEATIAQYAAENARFEAERAAAEAALRDATARAEAAEHRARAIEASMSWRVTAPLRAAMRRLGRG